MNNIVVVDLDNTLLKTDLLLEVHLKLLFSLPFIWVKSIWFLFTKGIYYHKSYLALNCEIDPIELPYRAIVIDLINQEIKSGNKIILATGSPLPWAKKIADHLGLFQDVIATLPSLSGEGKNLIGEKKLFEIKKRNPMAKLIYFGDSLSDLKIWKECDQCILINPSRYLLYKARKISTSIKVYQDSNSPILNIIKEMRVHHYSKNLLIFFPLILAHEWKLIDPWIQTLFAFISFSLTASMVYIINDLFDIEADRKHPKKRLRPFASGDLSLVFGPILLLILTFINCFIFAYLHPSFFYLSMIYLFGNLAYSIKWKEILILDVILLSAWYTFRLFIGGVVSKTILSPWLLAFSCFFFLSLALIKRYTELTFYEQSEKSTKLNFKLKLNRRGYGDQDQMALYTLGVVSSFSSLVILSLYLNSETVLNIYKHSNYLWILLPVLLFWICRLWVLANRFQIHDDPVIWMIKDKVSWIVLCIVIGVGIISL